MPAKRFLIFLSAVTFLGVPSALAGQKFSAYEGKDSIMEGRGGTKLSKHGVDYWDNGLPPRRFQVLGFITDRRKNNAITPDVIGSKGIAKATLKHGGDAVVVLSSREHFKGMASFGNAYAAGQGINAYGYSGAITDQVSTLAVIKYLD